jgi:hypothetical protein
MSEQDGRSEGELEQDSGRAAGWVPPPPTPPPPPPPPPPPTPPPPPGGVGSAPELWPSTIVSPGSNPLLMTPVEPLPVLVMLPDRLKQRRWTVLLRVFLAIPLAVVVFAIAVATAVCVVLGWFAAIVTGRVPEFVRTTVTVLLRMELRLEAYTFLLTDRFPPFSTEDEPAYGTRIAVPPGTRVNRFAVFFRVILVIPAAIAVRVTGLGLAVLAFFMWIVVLITGWLPRPIHEIYRVFIRYDLRLVAYFFLLVPTYPGELFGDLPPAPILAPVDETPGYFVREANKEAVRPPSQPWMLVLSMRAKRLLLVVIVLGVAAAIGLGIFDASVGNHQNLVQVNNQLVSDIDQFSAAQSNCATVSCSERANAVLSQQLGSFVSSLQSAPGAGVSQQNIAAMIAAAQNAQTVTETLSEAGSSPTAYRGLVAKTHADRILSRLVDEQRRFVQAVNAARFG